MTIMPIPYEERIGRVRRGLPSDPAVSALMLQEVASLQVDVLFNGEQRKMETFLKPLRARGIAPFSPLGMAAAAFLEAVDEATGECNAPTRRRWFEESYDVDPRISFASIMGRIWRHRDDPRFFKLMDHYALAPFADVLDVLGEPAALAVAGGPAALGEEDVQDFEFKNWPEIDDELRELLGLELDIVPEQPDADPREAAAAFARLPMSFYLQGYPRYLARLRDCAANRMIDLSTFGACAAAVRQMRESSYHPDRAKASEILSWMLIPTQGFDAAASEPGCLEGDGRHVEAFNALMGTPWNLFLSTCGEPDWSKDAELVSLGGEGVTVGCACARAARYRNARERGTLFYRALVSPIAAIAD